MAANTMLSISNTNNNLSKYVAGFTADDLQLIVQISPMGAESATAQRDQAQAAALNLLESITQDQIGATDGDSSSNTLENLQIGASQLSQAISEVSESVDLSTLFPNAFKTGIDGSVSDQNTAVNLSASANLRGTYTLQTQNIADENATYEIAEPGNSNLADTVDVAKNDNETVEKTAADYTGAGQSIVIIDTGFSYDYDQSSVIYSYDLSGDDDSDASVDSSDSHGSWVAAVATETASEVSIIHLKVSDDDGESISITDIEEALDYALTLSSDYDIAAVNLSLASGNTTTDVVTTLSDEFEALDAQDILVSCAAGNSGETYDDGVSTLAANDSVVCVSASDDDGSATSWTQSSETLTDIFADGTDWPVETLSGTTYSVSGTSYSAPTVAAITALLQEASEDINGEELTDEEILLIMQESGEAVTGYEDSDVDGYVVADAEAALTYFIENADTFTDDFLYA